MRRIVFSLMQFEYSLSGKWLELLKQVSPATVRVGVVRDPTVPSGIGQFAVIQSVAGSVGADVVPIGTRDASEIERPPATLGRIPATDARGLRRRRHYRLRRTCSQDEANDHPISRHRVSGFFGLVRPRQPATS
jgi:hypothetical protein